MLASIKKGFNNAASATKRAAMKTKRQTQIEVT
jgi:hypothetical protein